MGRLFRICMGCPIRPLSPAVLLRVFESRWIFSVTDCIHMYIQHHITYNCVIYTYALYTYCFDGYTPNIMYDIHAHTHIYIYMYHTIKVTVVLHRAVAEVSKIRNL